MTKDFYILGEFVPTSTQKFAGEDICPSDFIDFVKTLNEEDEVVIHMNSVGGDVFCGFQIANIVKNMKQHTSCVIEGLAASIASVVACACDEVQMYKNSYLMCHRCWTMVQGNSEQLMKEAEQMKKIDEQIIDFYTRHFQMTRDGLEAMISNETWISADEIGDYGFDARIIDDEVEYKIAAKAMTFTHAPFYNKTNNEDIEMNKEEQVEEEKKEVVVEEEQPKTTSEDVPVEEEEEKQQEEQPKTQENVEEEKPQENVEELKKEIDRLKNELDECHKQIEAMKDETVEVRVAKCQSTFQNKINDLKNEMRAKDEELLKFKDSVSRLETELNNSKKELQDMSAAFEEKKNALASLNAKVLTPSEELPTFHDGLKQCGNLKERVAYINSGKYTK